MARACWRACGVADDTSPVPILPRYRQVDFNSVGMAASIVEILTWPFDQEGGTCLSCHLDPIDGVVAKQLLRAAWRWCATVVPPIVPPPPPPSL
jgi:hypothetical protein